MSLGLVTGSLLWSLGGVVFPWFFMFFGSFCIALFAAEVSVTSSSLYQMASGEKKYLPSALLEILRLSHTFYGYTCILLVPICGRIFYFARLFSILQYTRWSADCLFYFPKGGTTPQVCALFSTTKTWLQSGRMTQGMLRVPMGQLRESTGKAFPATQGWASWWESVRQLRESTSFECPRVLSAAIPVFSHISARELPI